MKKPPILFASLTICLLLIVVAFSLLEVWPDNQVHVIHCDVGQGDAVLIMYNFTQVLIDSGRDRQVLRCLEKYLPFMDKTLEFVIATHPDNDHIAGFPAVFEEYSVLELFLLGAVKDTQVFRQFHTAVVQLQGNGTRVQLAQAGQRLILASSVELTILFPLQKVGKIEYFSAKVSETQLSDVAQKQNASIRSINDLSIATKLVVGDHVHLLMADLEKGGEQALLSQGLIPDIDVLKIGHHGSNTSSTMHFLEKSQPEYVVISSGKNNQYGHPHPKVLERVGALSSKVFRTDLDGDIEWVSDGRTFQWRTSRKHKN